jgi:hypothetical protein
MCGYIVGHLSGGFWRDVCAMTVEDVFRGVPVGTLLRFSGTENGAGKLVAKLPNCLDLEVWSRKGASLVLVLHADEGVDFEIERPSLASLIASTSYEPTTV